MTLNIKTSPPRENASAADRWVCVLYDARGGCCAPAPATNHTSQPGWRDDIWPLNIDDDDDGFVFDIIADAPRPLGRWPLDVDDDEYSNTDADLPPAPALRPWEYDDDHESHGD
jgi:hypothetical protein